MKYALHGPLSGCVTAPVSKSDLHRLIIAAALSFGEETVIEPYTMNDDIRATASVMEAAGAEIEFTDDFIRIRGIETVKKNFTADCRESGSTLRFLLPVMAALGADCSFMGQGRLPQRPLTPLVEQMKNHGVSFSDEFLPFNIKNLLLCGEYTFSGNISSQYISGLLFALPLLEGDSKILLTSPLESQGYVDMTLSVLKRFGIDIHVENPQEFHIKGGQRYRSPRVVKAEGDWSNAAFWLSAGAIGNPVTVTNLQIDSLQGDRAICEILMEMGAVVESEADSVTVVSAPLHGITIDGSQIPDILPILSVAAACAEGTTKIINAARLRIKESDRLAAIAEMLTAMGISVEETEDSLTIHGGKLLGGEVDSHNDHRMAMSAAVASLRCENPVILNNPSCVSKSYPHFFEEFCRLGGVVNVQHLG